MKKHLLLILCFVFSLMVSAESGTCGDNLSSPVFLENLPALAQIVLVDTEGNEYTCGQSMTIYAEVEVEGGVITYAECPCPSVKNKGSKDVKVAFTLTAKNLPKGTDVQFCWPDQCNLMSGRTSVTTGSGTVGAGKTMPTQVEWVPGYFDIDEGEYVYSQGSATIDYKLLIDGVDAGTVTITFVCSIDNFLINTVIEKINSIGIVVYTNECKSLIDAARQSYNALTDSQKALISAEQYKVLTDAEAAYAELVAAVGSYEEGYSLRIADFAMDVDGSYEAA